MGFMMILTTLFSLHTNLCSWLVMVFCAGKLHLSSVKIITSWKRWPSPLRASIWRKKIWKKELKAIRPLAVRAGYYYIFKKRSVLSVSSTFVRGTIRLLIALGKKVG